MVKIISDSTCDLSEELVKRYDITILPLHILLGDEEYLDGVNITRRRFLTGRMNTRPLQRLQHHPQSRQ